MSKYIEDLCFRLGIPTYCNDVVINLPLQPTNEIKPIANIMQDDVGWIYGLSMDADRTYPVGAGQPTLTTTQMMNMYLQLRNGSTNFGQIISLDKLLQVFNGTPIVDGSRYFSINIPGTFDEHDGKGSRQHFDISQSSYLNPNAYVSPAAPAPPIVIPLKLWYIPTAGASNLAKHGYFNMHHFRHHPTGDEHAIKIVKK
jgi:hypothetical protein